MVQCNLVTHFRLSKKTEILKVQVKHHDLQYANLLCDILSLVEFKFPKVGFVFYSDFLLICLC